MELVCRLLEVSRSGYYEWLGRKPSLRRQKDQELKRRLLSLHQRYPALGLDSLYHLIRPQLSCSRKRIHRLMNEMNISSTRRRAYKATTNSRHAHPIAPNLLARRFSFDKPDTAWVGDITYIPTGEGWLYCAVVKDLCTKQIVGYAFSDRIDTNLTLAALGMAVRRRKPLPGLIFHSDRGVQYAAYAYRQRLASLGIRQSMSRKGDPYDNAVAENFFSCLKCECVHLRHFASRAHDTTRYPAFLSVFSSFLLSTKPGRAQFLELPLDYFFVQLYNLLGHGLPSPFRMVCRDFILPELCKPCLFLSSFQFAKIIVPYQSIHPGYSAVALGSAYLWGSFFNHLEGEEILASRLKKLRQSPLLDSAAISMIL